MLLPHFPLKLPWILQDLLPLLILLLLQLLILLQGYILDPHLDIDLDRLPFVIFVRNLPLFESSFQGLVLLFDVFVVLFEPFLLAFEPLLVFGLFVEFILLAPVDVFL